MNIEKFTTKSQSIIAKAQFLATDKQHTQVESIHLLLALHKEDQNMLPFVAQQGEIQSERLRTALEAAYVDLPTSSSAAETYRVEMLPMCCKRPFKRPRV